ncbi:MAG: DUF3127 domain-containing protein [Bacteroidaceae bacterium]|nr:DUF3127 domain-containing protein [Bacteroidaceae bacterium]
MEIQGKIIAVLDKRSGTSARTGNTWAVQEYVVETHDQYPRKCMFNVFGEDKINNFNIQIGDEVTVSFDIDAREYNGRWYNDVRAWNVVKGAAPMPGQPMGAPVAQQNFVQHQPTAAPVQQSVMSAPTTTVAPATLKNDIAAADPFTSDSASGDDLPF